MVTGYGSQDFARKAKKIMIDIDNNELKNSRVKPDQTLNCDANYFLKNFYYIYLKKLVYLINGLNTVKISEKNTLLF